MLHLRHNQKKGPEVIPPYFVLGPGLFRVPVTLYGVPLATQSVLHFPL